MVRLSDSDTAGQRPFAYGVHGRCFQFLPDETPWKDRGNDSSELVSHLVDFVDVKLVGCDRRPAVVAGRINVKNS